MKPFLWTVLVVSVSGAFLFYVWEKVDVVRVGYELDALSKQKAALEREHDRLRVRLSQLRSPNRIARKAAEQLGMRRPEPKQVVLVPSLADFMTRENARQLLTSDTDAGADDGGVENVGERAVSSTAANIDVHAAPPAAAVNVGERAASSAAANIDARAVSPATTANPAVRAAPPSTATNIDARAVPPAAAENVGERAASSAAANVDARATSTAPANIDTRAATSTTTQHVTAVTDARRAAVTDDRRRGRAWRVAQQTSQR